MKDELERVRKGAFNIGREALQEVKEILKKEVPIQEKIKMQTINRSRFTRKNKSIYDSSENDKYLLASRKDCPKNGKTNRKKNSRENRGTSVRATPSN